MLDRLSAAFVQQKRFTADASHELRTPVTAILGQSELALRRARSPEAYQDTLVRIRDEAQRMQRLIGRMLALARAEGGQQVLTFAATDVAALLRSLEDTLVPSDAVSNVRLRMDVPSEAVIVTDADILTQILLNLLENAIAYTEHGTVNVTLAMHTDTMQIQIRDNGPGIDPAHFTQIFQPFFRSDPARQRREGNVGLGLALTHELTHLIGGRIEAANHPEGGAVFTLTVPRRPTTHSAA
jgi:two-component system OmpR family sensor kinase